MDYEDNDIGPVMTALLSKTKTKIKNRAERTEQDSHMDYDGNGIGMMMTTLLSKRNTPRTRKTSDVKRIGQWVGFHLIKTKQLALQFKITYFALLTIKIDVKMRTIIS